VGFIAELRERRLVQIFFSYIGASWIFLQVIDHFVGRSILPEIVYQVAFIWFVVGIPAALLIGWHHGEKGVQRAPMSEMAVLAILALAGVGFSGNTVRGHMREKSQMEAQKDALRVNSVAVLYFEDLSGGENQYLADGLTEDLITELTAVNELNVISRNGTLQFRGSEAEVDSIASELGVGTVIRGTVETKGDKIVIQVDVLDGLNGERWDRAKIERPRSDLLAMRAEIVEETARMLREAIGQELRTRRHALSTSNTDAWLMSQRAEKLRKDAESLIAQGDMAGGWAVFDSADAMLEQAHALDRAWSTPFVERAAIAYRRARLSQASPADAVELIGAGIALADSALVRDRNDARALDLRGTLAYYHWLLNVSPDVTAHDALLARAQADLETAVKLDQSLASAYATLSHLYFQNDISEAVIAAQRAYEKDAYLQVADVVLWRLFNGSVELENFENADKWCREGSRRFPADYRFVACQLRMMSTPGVKVADLKADSAWKLLARQDTLVPPARKVFEHLRSQLVVGGVLARAGLADSARAVLDDARAQITPEIDRTQELVLVEAYMRILSGQKDRAVDLLSRNAAAHPEQFARNGTVSWWWRSLESDPRFRRLAGLD
jgi:eukaryotic-like serine/threonine-protein kinase